MVENKLFKFEWEIAIPNIILGFAFAMMTCVIAFGYVHSMYDLSHIVLFVMVAVLWGTSGGCSEYNKNDG